MDAQAAIESVHKLEQTTESYYLAAAEKIKALSEVSHALKTIVKKHTTHLKQLSEVNL